MGEIGNGGGTGRGINLGDILHIAQIVALFISVGIFYQQSADTREKVDKHSESLERIEHYLSSKDAQYWYLSQKDK
jgi:hypothetical protein